MTQGRAKLASLTTRLTARDRSGSNPSAKEPKETPASAAPSWVPQVQTSPRPASRTARIREAMPPSVRAAVNVASLLAVAVVPGAAMAAGAITVAADTYCTYGSFCLYSGPNFTGQKVEYTQDQMFCQDSRPPLNVPSVLPQGARSVANNTRTANSGLGVKIYSASSHLVLATVKPGSEVSDLDGEIAREMATLCAYPRK